MDLKIFNTEEIKKLLAKDDFILIDSRPLEDFAEAYIPGSLYLAFNGKDPTCLNAIFTNDTQIGIVASQINEIEPIVKVLNTYGFTRILGYALKPLASWIKADEPVDLVIAIEADELAMDIPHDDNMVLIDVRSEMEYAEGHLAGAQPLPLSEMGDPANIALIPELANIYLYCDGGSRSMTAASILKRHGLHNFRVVQAEWALIRETAGLKIEKDNRKLN